MNQKDFSEFGVPAIHYGQIYTYYGNETQDTLSFVSPETAKQLKKVYPGNIVITNISENIEDVCKSVLYSGSLEAVTGGHSTIIRTKDCILPKYLVYYTLTLDFFTQKKRLAKGAKVIDVSAKDLAKIIIPSPPSLRAAPHCGDPRPLRHTDQLHQRGTAARDCPASQAI